MSIQSQKHNLGFTLIELAIVLIIVGLLFSAILTPIFYQQELANVKQARQDIDDAKTAIVGFAMINGRLPCPDNNGDGNEDACTANTFSTISTGNLPWATLGVKQNDSWQRRYLYTLNNGFSAPFLINSTGNGAGIIRICTNAACTLLLEANNVPFVIVSRGSNGGATPAAGSDEDQNVNGDRDFVSKEIATAGSTFDDVLGWVSTQFLMGKMVAVGKLP